MKMLCDPEDFVEPAPGHTKKYYICYRCDLDCITNHDVWCPICRTEIEWTTQEEETLNANSNT